MDKAFLSAIKSIILPAIAMGTIPLVIARDNSQITAQLNQRLSIKKVIYPCIEKCAYPHCHSCRTHVWYYRSNTYRNYFLVPGIGKWLLRVLLQETTPSFRGVLIIAILIISINFSVDIIYAWANQKEGKIK